MTGSWCNAHRVRSMWHELCVCYHCPAERTSNNFCIPFLVLWVAKSSAQLLILVTVAQVHHVRWWYTSGILIYIHQFMHPLTQCSCSTPSFVIHPVTTTLPVPRPCLTIQETFCGSRTACPHCRWHHQRPSDPCRTNLDLSDQMMHSAIQWLGSVQNAHFWANSNCKQTRRSSRTGFFQRTKPKDHAGTGAFGLCSGGRPGNAVPADQHHLWRGPA